MLRFSLFSLLLLILIPNPRSSAQTTDLPNIIKIEPSSVLIHYPSTWQAELGVDNQEPSGALLTNGDIFIFLFAEIDVSTTNSSCETPACVARERVQEFPVLFATGFGFAVEQMEIEEILLEGKNALRLDFTMTNNNQIIKSAVFAVELENGIYVMATVLFMNRDHNLVIRILESLEILPTASTQISQEVGERILFSADRDSDRDFEIYSIDLSGNNLHKLTDNDTDDSIPTLSPDGSQILFLAFRDLNPEIYVMNYDGTNPTRLTNTPIEENFPTWLPDGTMISFTAFGLPGSTADIYTLGIDGGSRNNLTNNPANDAGGVWSPDGEHFIFASDRDGSLELYHMSANGDNLRRLTFNDDINSFVSWFPDGSRIVFTGESGTDIEIYLMDLETGEIQNLTNNPALDTYPSVSPDGTRIAFSSNRDGNFEIYVMDANGENVRRLTFHPANDWFPSWVPAP